MYDTQVHKVGSRCLGSLARMGDNATLSRNFQRGSRVCKDRTLVSRKGAPGLKTRSEFEMVATVCEVNKREVQREGRERTREAGKGSRGGCGTFVWMPWT